jgi:DNA-binding transcriptional ArsR family regulator
MTRPAISQHLRILLRARLVQVRRDGRERYYRLHARPLRQIHDWVRHYERFWRGNSRRWATFWLRKRRRNASDESRFDV